MTVYLKDIRIDCGTQARASISEEVVGDYVEKLKDGVIFPPVILFFDGVHHYLADGFHRYHAHLKKGEPDIAAEVRNGTLRDAILFSLSANNQHGLRRTNSDKRKAVQTMLEDFEWTDWSDREIARQCHVSNIMVGNLRKELGATKSDTTYERGGKVLTMRPKQEFEQAESEDLEEDYDPSEDAIQHLQEDNIRLQDRLAVMGAEGTQEEKNLAGETIAGLREQIKILEIELASVKQSRDAYQSENAQLKKQIAINTKKQKAA